MLFFQSMRLKVISNNSTIERRFSSWIGGSILASLVRMSHTLCSHVFVAPLLSVISCRCRSRVRSNRCGYHSASTRNKVKRASSASVRRRLSLFFSIEKSWMTEFSEFTLAVGACPLTGRCMLGCKRIGRLTM